jgi:uncharacterized protein (DUF2237 family)
MVTPIDIVRAQCPAVCAHAARSGNGSTHGYCWAQDVGSHTVCARMTEEFFAFAGAGNDPRWRLNSTSCGRWGGWCLCVARWREALAAGVAPPVVLAATHEKALNVVTLEQLSRNALDRQ